MDCSNKIFVGVGLTARLFLYTYKEKGTKTKDNDLNSI